MFSLRIRSKMEGNRGLQVLGNYSFLWAVLAMFIVGGIAGSSTSATSWTRASSRRPTGAAWSSTSPLCIGWGSADMWIDGIPMALMRG